MLGVSRHDKDAKKQLKKLLNMSEQVYVWLDQRKEKHPLTIRDFQISWAMKWSYLAIFRAPKDVP